MSRNENVNRDGKPPATKRKCDEQENIQRNEHSSLEYWRKATHGKEQQLHFE